MIESRSVRLSSLFFALAVALLLLVAGSADATSCSGDCEGTDCTGGCSINSVVCSTACIDDGCPGTATCKEYGDSTQCYHEFTSSCEQVSDEDPFPNGPEQQLKGASRTRSSLQWSVMEYPTDEISPLALRDVEVLGTSTSWFADQSVDDLLVSVRQDAAALKARLRSRELQRETRFPTQRRLRYSVSPGTGCVRAVMDLSQRRLPLDVPGQATVLFRATVDAQGEVTAVKVLHTLRTDGTEKIMARFLKDHATLRRTDGGEGPFEAFVVFFAQQDQSAGWIVSGAEPLL